MVAILLFTILVWKNSENVQKDRKVRKVRKVRKDRKVIHPKFFRFPLSLFDHLAQSSQPLERIGRIGNRNTVDDESGPSQYAKRPWKADEESVLRNRDFRNRCGDRAMGKTAVETEMRVRVFPTRVSAWIPNRVIASHSVARIMKTLKKDQKQRFKFASYF